MDVLTCADAMVRRIETTKKTDSLVFEECGQYLDAASSLYGRKIKISDNKLDILKCQLMALELMKIVPDLKVIVENKLTRYVEESIVPYGSEQ